MLIYDAKAIPGYEAACAARNESVQALRNAWLAKHGAPDGDMLAPGQSAAEWMRSRETAYAEWAKRSGFDRFMARVYRMTYQRHGFVPCPDAKGWRFNGI